MDSSAVLLDKDLNVLEKIWFRNLRSAGDAVTHRCCCAQHGLRAHWHHVLFVVCSGDDRTGEGGGDDEVRMNTLLLLVVCPNAPFYRTRSIYLNVYFLIDN